MQRTYPNVETYNPNAQQSLARLEALAKLMDGAFVIPGTNIRMGLDGIIGLVPIAGERMSEIVLFDWKTANANRDKVIERWNKEML